MRSRGALTYEAKQLHPNQKNFLLLILKRLVPAGLPWVSMYWIFSGVIILMLLTLSASRFPQVERTEEEQAGAVGMYGHLLKKPIVLLFFVSIFMYVGSEQGPQTGFRSFSPSITGTILTPPVRLRSRGSGDCSRQAVGLAWYC
jgi:hypothetical protein